MALVSPKGRHPPLANLFQLPGRVAALLDILDRTPVADRPTVLAAAQIPQVHLRLLDTPAPNLGDRGEPDAEAMRHRIEAALSAPRPVIVADRYRPADQKAGWAGGRVENGTWIEAALANGQWLLVVWNLDPPRSVWSGRWCGAALAITGFGHRESGSV